MNKASESVEQDQTARIGPETILSCSCIQPLFQRAYKSYINIIINFIISH